MLGAAQAVAQNLNSMTTSIQQLRTQAEQGIANDVQTANNALQQIAQINQQLEGSTASDSSAATLEDQRDQDITQLAQLMNIRVVQNPANQISVFTGTGLQLVAGSAGLPAQFRQCGNAVGDVAVERQSEQGRRRHDHAGVAGRHHHRSDRQQRDPVGRARRLYPDARQHPAAGADPARRIGQPDVAGAVEPDDQRDRGYFRRAVRIQRRRRRAVCRATRSSSPIPIPAIFSTRSRSSRSVSRRHAAAAELAANPNDQVIGIDFSGGMSSVVAQLNAALGANLQFSNPSGTVLQVLNSNGTSNVVNSLSATSTVTSLTSGSPQLPLFIDGNHADHRRDHRDRLANDGPCRAHHRQSRACRLAVASRRLCVRLPPRATRPGRISCSIR